MSKVQVLVFGHHLSSATKAWVYDNYGPFRIFGEHLHVDQMKDVEVECLRCLDAVEAQGADLSGRTKTLWVRPGLGIAGDTMLALLHGSLGEFPVSLNLMKSPEGPYAPSPELPVVDLQSIRNNVGRRRRRNQSLQEEVV